ncbi:MAG: hypothetical protein UT39_C0030G0004 [Candidatus Woesebacteria bacterium GW2011_GWA1_39_21]|uniref:Uncharacterized protein n=1 Tax=Candidatus Woesebacteria bacterium GW2011_GWA1_39_21 TaxID=1618550 RepID=A0A0G0NA75_9BACT|nr:MAG: hypothetical protein UT39_C0030G0004 [Candidatus Woesebacteria bacterium GW2011_GWA1_39_21]
MGQSISIESEYVQGRNIEVGTIDIQEKANEQRWDLLQNRFAELFLKKEPVTEDVGVDLLTRLNMSLRDKYWRARSMPENVFLPTLAKVNIETSERDLRLFQGLLQSLVYGDKQGVENSASAFEKVQDDQADIIRGVISNSKESKLPAVVRGIKNLIDKKNPLSGPKKELESIIGIKKLLAWARTANLSDTVRRDIKDALPLGYAIPLPVKSNSAIEDI